MVGATSGSEFPRQEPGRTMQQLLIVENDDAQLTQISEFLERWGYAVHRTATATGAIGWLATNTPDLALIDLHLPDGPGIEILKNIRDSDGAIPIPVLMVSATDSPEIRIVCMSTGANDFLPMPLNFADLSMKIQQALELTDHKKEIHALNKKLEKEKRSLLRFFPEDFVEKILNEEISAELGGAIVPASIMFFDIRGSTTLAEKIGPHAYAETISTLFTDIMDIIFGRAGSINELLGDGILATFGCPTPTENDAKNAVSAATAIAGHMAMLNEMRQADGEIPFGFGIGIASGKIFAGNIGSIRLMKYAVMGDPVNTAARIQDLTKELPHAVIIDENTYKNADASANGSEAKFVELPLQKLRGKVENTILFGLVP